MRTLYFILIVSLAGCAASTTAQRLDEQTAQTQAVGRPILIYQVNTKYLSNISPQGGYTQVKFANTGARSIAAIAFDVVPYAHGEPVLRVASYPVLFGAKGNFKPGETYTVTSDKPVWSGLWKRVDCVHVVGVMLGYADGQIAKISRDQVSSYMRPEIAAQNCTNPSTPGPHN